MTNLSPAPCESRSRDAEFRAKSVLRVPDVPVGALRSFGRVRDEVLRPSRGTR